jgi:hypothetical protein
VGKAAGKSTPKSRKRRNPLAGKTQKLRPALFVDDKETTFLLLWQQVPAEIKTNSDVKAVSEAAAKAITHSGKVESGSLGYDANTLVDFHKRVAKGLHTRPEALDDIDRTAAKKQRIRKENAMAARVRKERPDLETRRDVAKEVARRLGRKSHRVIETRIPTK